MSSSQVIEETIARMDTEEILQRWRDGMFSDEARPIVEKEILKRNLDIHNPATFVPELVEIRPRKPVVLPALFAAISGSTTGATFGAAIAASIGAGVGAVLLGALGWKLGGLVANFSLRQQKQVVRILICCVALGIWFLLNAILAGRAGE